MPFVSIMISHEYWEAYHEKLAALDLNTHPTSFIPQDWALNAVDIASEWVEQQFAAHVASKPLVPAPPELDPKTMLACRHLAFVLAEAYQHPIKLDIDVIQYNEALTKRESGLNDAHEEALLAKFPPAKPMLLDRPSVVIDAGCRIILWYLPGALNWSLQCDMFTATKDGEMENNHVELSPRTRTWSNSQVHQYFTLLVSTGHECQGPPPQNPLDGCIPEVSATLKSDRSLSSIIDMQCPALLSSAALRVMHPQLYRASMFTHVELGHWAAAHGEDQMYRCLQHWVSAYSGAVLRQTVVCD
ncbi:uncharacterized protein F5147DRAFT_782212 [Suillus discolor]|uniref:Uncharacterized protein n=1 Tax=Suillus discolor TaxID=1912936 RepID=A0A9P7JLD5_9AGAM|nr:uncharacterized protein F5147DRAFT_782212 [Suillus discolor]KAG2085104.1 hypothetical protein F5147DRAFT_782212 [Suillus discolor]